MAKQLFANNAEATLASAITAGDTTLSLSPGGGTPYTFEETGDWHLVTIDTGAAVEIVKVTGRSGDNLTVVRAQEGTTAISADAGAKVESRVTAATMRSCQRNLGSGSGAFALGIGPYSYSPSASATGAYATALGIQAAANADNAVAVGYNCIASGVGSVAIGANVTAAQAGAINIAGYVESPGAVGIGEYVWTANAWRVKGLPCLQRDDWYFGSGVESYGSAEALFSTIWVDLGNGVPWATATTYKDGDVVVPTTPNGRQYHMWHGAYDAMAKPNQLVSGGTEPTWTTTVGDSNDDGDTYWICVDAAAGFSMDIPDEMVFYPSEISFVCFNYASVTAAPYVSVGVTGTPGALVNNQQLTSITGANQRHVFTGFTQGVTTAMTFKVNTPATGTNSQFHGRFVVKGTFIQKQG